MPSAKRLRYHDQVSSGEGSFNDEEPENDSNAVKIDFSAYTTKIQESEPDAWKKSTAILAENMWSYEPQTGHRQSNVTTINSSSLVATYKNASLSTVEPQNLGNNVSAHYSVTQHQFKYNGAPEAYKLNTTGSQGNFHRHSFVHDGAMLGQSGMTQQGDVSSTLVTTYRQNPHQASSSIFKLQQTHPSLRIKAKKDALWKPLLRRFRKFIQEKLFQERLNGKIFNQSVRTRSEVYFRALNLPEHLQNCQRTLFAVFALIESSTVVSKRQIKPEFRAIFGQHFDYVSCYFVRIFVENSVAQRLKFFSDPLIQFLWTKFRLRGGGIFREILGQLQDSPELEGSCVQLQSRPLSAADQQFQLPTTTMAGLSAVMGQPGDPKPPKRPQERLSSLKLQYFMQEIARVQEATGFQIVP